MTNSIFPSRVVILGRLPTKGAPACKLRSRLPLKASCAPMRSKGASARSGRTLNDIGAPIISSIVVVAQPRAKHFSGDPCRLRVHLTVEGGPDVNVSHDPGAGRRHDAMRWRSATPSALCGGAWKIPCGEEPPFHSDGEDRAERLRRPLVKYKIRLYFVVNAKIEMRTLLI